jgi:TonB family protein
MPRTRWERMLLHPVLVVMLGISVVACAHRVAAGRLSGAPVRLWSPPLMYPLWLMRLGIEGVVVLQARVDADGRVERHSVRVLSSSYHGFDEAAIDMLAGTRFIPAQRDGAPVASTVEMPVTFAVADTILDSLAAAAAMERAEQAAKTGDFVTATAAFNEARRLDMRLVESPAIWWTLCWYGSLWGYAENVISTCDRLVAMDPAGVRGRDARGIARALTGNFRGAIADFEVVVGSSASPRLRDQRSTWIAELRAGRNPVTPELIADLRRAAIP